MLKETETQTHTSRTSLRKLQDHERIYKQKQIAATKNSTVQAKVEKHGLRRSALDLGDVRLGEAPDGEGDGAGVGVGAGVGIGAGAGISEGEVLPLGVEAVGGVTLLGAWLGGCKGGATGGAVGGRGIGVGQLPQLGKMTPARAEFWAKFVGIETKLLTHQVVRFWLKADAPENMAPIFVTEVVFQRNKGLLNEVARLNVSAKLVTCEISHELMSWLNDVASPNIPPSVVTEDTSQLSSGWLKAAA